MGKSFYSVITEAALYTRGFGGNLEATTPVLHGLFLWGGLYICGAARRDEGGAWCYIFLLVQCFIRRRSYFKLFTFIFDFVLLYDIDCGTIYFDNPYFVWQWKSIRDIHLYD